VHPFDFSQPFEIICNAFDLAVVAILGQRVNKISQVIYYASRTLTNCQKNNSTAEKELLVVAYT